MNSTSQKKNVYTTVGSHYLACIPEGLGSCFQDWQSWLRLFMVSLGLSKQMLGLYPNKPCLPTHFLVPSLIMIILTICH